MTYASFRDARIAWMRDHVAAHRECCGHLLSYQIVSRALDAYDGKDVPSVFAADVAVINGMSRRDSDYNTYAARWARYLYRETAKRRAVAA